MPVSLPINTLKGNWARLHSTERLRRSSHVVSVIDKTVYIFGGEVQPRQPIDDQIDVLSLQSGTASPNPAAHHGTNNLQTRQTTKPNPSQQPQVPALEQPLQFSTARCTSSPVAAGRIWRLSKKTAQCGATTPPVHRGPRSRQSTHPSLIPQHAATTLLLAMARTHCSSMPDALLQAASPICGPSMYLLALGRRLPMLLARTEEAPRLPIAGRGCTG